MNVRSDSILANLTQAQLADLYDWILGSDGYASVQTRAAKPVDEGGLGLNIHITTLTRFYAGYTAWVRAKEIADGERDADSSPDRLHASAASELAHAVHDLAHGPLKPADLKLIAKYLQQQRDHALKTEYLKIAQHHAAIATQKQKLAEDRLAEQVRQWEFNGAREVMKAYIAYEEIDKRTDIDEIDKIWEARKVAYGPRADETPKPNRASNTPRYSPAGTRLPARHSLGEGGGPPVSGPAREPQQAADTIVNTGSHFPISGTPRLTTQDSELRTEAQPQQIPPCPPNPYAQEGYLSPPTVPFNSNTAPPPKPRRYADRTGFWPNDGRYNKYD